jgi:hypothetical protein
MDAEETKQLFDRMFERDKDDPEEWGATAWNLRTAANVLFDAYGETWEPDGEPAKPENQNLDSPASMLYGGALENMIKGYLIKKHGGFEQARAADQFAWDRHQISQLAAATGLLLTYEQKLLLRSLESFVVWAGRYPISMKRQQFTLPKQFQSGDHMTPSTLNSAGVKLLEPLYKQLEDEVFAELRKNFGDWNPTPP